MDDVVLTERPKISIWIHRWMIIELCYSRDVSWKDHSQVDDDFIDSLCSPSIRLSENFLNNFLPIESFTSKLAQVASNIARLHLCALCKLPTPISNDGLIAMLRTLNCSWKVSHCVKNGSVERNFTLTLAKKDFASAFSYEAAALSVLSAKSLALERFEGSKNLVSKGVDVCSYVF